MLRGRMCTLCVMGLRERGGEVSIWEGWWFGYERGMYI